MNKTEITRIFKKELNTKASSIIDKSKGVNQEVKIVETDSGKFVIKVPHNEKDKILKEVIGTKLCSKKSVPVPEIIFFNETMLIETYIEGADLDDLKTSKKNFEQIYLEIGKLIRKMHSIAGTGFGSVNSNKLIGRFKTQKESNESWVFKEIERLEKTKHYPEEDLNRIKKFYNENKHILRTRKSVLLHSDITDSNIVIKNNKVSAFIDFGDLSAGPAMQDFAFIYIDHFGDYKFEKLLEGYGKHNIEEIRFYAFCWMIWLLASKIEKKEFDKKFRRMKTLFHNIWNP
ncbi:MAG: aminoglycoside phosphotransferase family protein [Candidatus Woesearchaeota archaeon]